MTPEEIQQLIEILRAETQKGGNTKERVANILTKLNEKPSGGADLTLEQARENGNILAGDVILDSSNQNIKIKSLNDRSSISIDDTETLQLNYTESEINNNVGLGENYFSVSSNNNNFTGILGSEEFDKQGDRKAFAQMSDVFDNAGGSIPTGTERQVLGWSSTGTAEPVRLGWKQLSDLPSPPIFSNGVLTGTAFQPDGTALFAFTKLAIDSPEASTIPFYQSGGKLLTEAGTSGKEAINFSQLPVNIYGNFNPPTLAQLTGIKRGDYYIQTSNGTSSGSEIQRARFNGNQLEEWLVTSAVFTALTQAQKDAVKYFNVTP